MSQKSGPRLAKVVNAYQLTSNMRRVTLGGSALADFPTGFEGGYIKLLFPPTQPSEGSKPIMRTYTVRKHRPESNELDIDFVVHGESGTASKWCQQARLGEEIPILGPGSLKKFNKSAAWYLFVADMAAMPAAIATIENLPETAVGRAFFEILSPEDRQPVNAPPGIEIDWLVQGKSGRSSDLLVEKVRNLDFPEEELGIFVAGEWSMAAALREHLRKDREIERRTPYVSSYWKLGSNEEDHKELKKSIAN